MAEFGDQMVAAYTVHITGIDRTQKELDRLSTAIKSFRTAQYSQSVPSITVASQLGSSDIFLTKMADLRGRVQSGVEKAMLKGMASGRRIQIDTLRQATTRTGLSGKSHTKGGRKGPGREDSGAMIREIKTNVESYKGTGDGTVTGWHGWRVEGRAWFSFQEKGTRGHSRKPRIRRRAVATYLNGGSANGGVPAANSLGRAIFVVRRQLEADLKGLKR